MFMPVEKAKTIIASEIGEGVHTYLRKFCESDESHTAWVAIRDLPQEEWNGLCEMVAEQITLRLKKESE